MSKLQREAHALSIREREWSGCEVAGRQVIVCLFKNFNLMIYNFSAFPNHGVMEASVLQRSLNRSAFAALYAGSL